MDTSAKVSIGLPVYNGENYLAAAIESVLAQTYANFELIICDNASEDGTPKICQDFAALDSRIGYYRQLTNLGAAANHNKCLGLASGQYFKWISHDDLLEPHYLEACVKILNDHSDAILAQSIVHCIDEQGRVFEVYDHSAWGTGSARQSERFGAAVRNHRCLEIFGLVRTEAMPLEGSYAGSDQTLLAELALRGRFALVPEPLFLNRDHPGRSSRWKNRLELFTWWTGLRGRWVCSTWLFYLDCLRLINRHASTPGERFRCYGHLMASIRQKGRARLLLFEPLAMIDPRIYTFGRATKRVLGLHTSPRGRSVGAPGDVNTFSHQNPEISGDTAGRHVGD